MSSLSRISIRGLAKAFPLRPRKRVLGVATDVIAACRYLLQRTLAPGNVDNAPRRGSKDFFYALDAIDFDVLPGQILGIIGRNGAGKSTLLKILARVLAPTEGRITIRGRLVSLLELGVGFASELTVRENIELYSRLAGIRTARIPAAEAQILAMARLTEYRDMPLQACPSGSFVQLAFAAMISLDADIVLADEILAVGDSAFRRTCEECISDIAASGGSVLFVSHDMNAIRRICNRVIWIDKGRIRQDGATDQVVQAYTTELLAGRLTQSTTDDVRAGCQILDMRLLDGDDEQIGALQITEAGRIDCIFRIERPDISVYVQLELRDIKGKVNILTSTTPLPVHARHRTAFHAGVRIPANLSNKSSYQARCRLFVQNRTDPSATPVAVAEEQMDFAVLNPTLKNRCGPAGRGDDRAI